MRYKYDGQIDPIIHIESCVKSWKHKSVDDQVHLFVHTLDTIPKNWYIETELCRGSENWYLMIDGFKLTFGFEFEYPENDDALEMIRTKVFEDGSFPLYNQPDQVAQLENALACYNLAVDEEEDPRNVNILELEGARKVQGPKVEILEKAEKVKIKKINIGMEGDPKFASIGDY